MSKKDLEKFLRKEQTPQQQKKMKKLCEAMFDEGFTPEDIVDAGDYILDQMKLEELKGEKENEVESRIQGATKKGTDKSAKSKGKVKVKAKGKSKDKSKGKAKGKKSK